MNWPVYNKSLVRRGNPRLDVIDNWNSDLKDMDKDKVGKEPFHYPNTFLLLLGYANKAYSHLPCRQTEGIAQGHVHGKLPSIPDHTTINRGLFYIFY